MQNFAQKNMADVNIYVQSTCGFCTLQAVFAQEVLVFPHELLCFINESNVALGVFCFLVINALSVVVLKP
jgi:hypothetical protein